MSIEKAPDSWRTPNITDAERIDAIAWAISPSDAGVLIHDMTGDWSVVAEAVVANQSPIEETLGRGQDVRAALDGLVAQHRKYLRMMAELEAREGK